MVKTIIIALVVALITGVIALQYKSFKEWSSPNLLPSPCFQNL